MTSLVEKAMPPEGFKARERPGEQIRGGYFLIRRGRWGGRIKPSDRPFEHPSYESALTERDRLEKLHPGLEWAILADLEIHQF